MAEYEMQESNLPNEEGKRILFPRMKLWNQVDLEYIAKNINYASTFTPGDIMGLVRSLTQEIANQMAQGNSVKVDASASSPPHWLAPRQRTRIGRKRRAATKLNEHLRAEHQFPCRQAIHRRNRKTLHTEPVGVKARPFIAEIHTGTTAGVGTKVSGGTSLYESARLLPTDRFAAKHRRQGVEALERNTGNRHYHSRTRFAQAVCKAERDSYPLRFR